MKFIEEVPRACIFCDGKCDYIAVESGLFGATKLLTLCKAHKDKLLELWKWKKVER